MSEYVDIEMTTPFPDEPTVFNIVVGIAPDSRRVIAICQRDGKHVSESRNDIINNCEWECLLNTILDVIVDSL